MDLNAPPSAVSEEGAQWLGPASRTGRTVNAPKLPYETGVVLL
jgi:hypothetical protein